MCDWYKWIFEFWYLLFCTVNVLVAAMSVVMVVEIRGGMSIWEFWIVAHTKRFTIWEWLSKEIRKYILKRSLARSILDIPATWFELGKYAIVSNICAKLG